MVDHDSIRDVAKRIYKEFATFDPFKICLYKDILVQYAPLGSLNAHYSKLYRIPIITINADLDERSAVFACFHELGHLFLKHNDNTIYCSQKANLKVSPWEEAADRFAVEYLLLQLDRDDREYYTKQQLAVLAGIPEELTSLIE